MKYLWLLVFGIIACSKNEKPELSITEDYSYLQKRNKTLIVLKLILSPLENNYKAQFPQILHNALMHYNYELTFIEKLIQVLQRHDSKQVFEIEISPDLEEKNIKYQPYIGKRYPEELHKQGYKIIIEISMQVFYTYKLRNLQIIQQTQLRLIDAKTHKTHRSQEKLHHFNIQIHHQDFKSKALDFEQIIASSINYSILDISRFLLKLG